jgi:hypothetical protein
VVYRHFRSTGQYNREYSVNQHSSYMTKRARNHNDEGVPTSKLAEKGAGESSQVSQHRNKKRKSQDKGLVQRERSSSSNYEVTDEEHDMAVKLLREVNWAKCQNTSRRNVIRLGDKKTPKNSVGKEYCHSFIFGKNMKDSTGGLSYWSTEYEELYAFFQSLINRVHPEHNYTNITVNKNLVCKKHTDGGNTGRSYIISFGNFTGGRLIIEKKGGGDPRPMDIFRKFVGFEGSLQPHETESFEGERYSAVFYTSSIVPTEAAPRVRPPMLPPTAAVGDASASGDAAATGSAAMKQRFQEMKKKLQGKLSK